MTLPIGTPLVTGEKGCESCAAHYRIASGPGLTEVGSSCVRRTCAEGSSMSMTPETTPCVASSLANTYEGCYFGYMRRQGRMGTNPAALASSECVRVDGDGDGLIDITTLTQLHNMRHELDGSSYNTATSTVAGECGSYGDTDGDYTRANCNGYELMNNLNFDSADTDTTTFTDAGMLDSDDTAAPYFVVANGGWEPIGSDDTAGKFFDTTFEGNGHDITGLAIRRGSTTHDDDRIGMFGFIGSNAEIKNIHLIDNLVEHTSTTRSGAHVGGLVGSSAGGMITKSSTRGGIVKGTRVTGGLVGLLDGGKIESSFVADAADAADGTVSAVNGQTANLTAGGLVGRSIGGGKIIASYATVTVTGAAGNDKLGGLVGESRNSQIIASYATGDTITGGGGDDSLGGLVGNFRVDRDKSGTIAASYATGDVMGEAGADHAGGLIGNIPTFGVSSSKAASIVTVIASYATGNVTGGAANGVLGGLVGRVDSFSTDVTFTATYATGNVTGGTDNDTLGGLVGQFTQDANGKIIASYANNGTLDLDNGNDREFAGPVVGDGVPTLDTGASPPTSPATKIISSYGFVEPVRGSIMNMSVLINDYFGPVNSVESTQTPRSGLIRQNNITIATDLTSATSDNAGEKWDQAGSNTLGAWFFGTGAAPTLQFNDYDGSGGTIYSCSDDPSTSAMNRFTITIGSDVIRTIRSCGVSITQ